MKPTPARMPLRPRGALVALSVAAMMTQVSRASAAPERVDSRPVTTVAAAIVPPVGPAQLAALASLWRAPPVSGGWPLLVAGLIGVWAIGHRRLSAPESRSLDPHRLRRG